MEAPTVCPFCNEHTLSPHYLAFLLTEASLKARLLTQGYDRLY